MDTDDLEPLRPNLATPLDLEEMSIEALGDYIDALNAEIKRVEEAILKKQGAQGAAEALFKS
ncbi:DUF1192 domain-containing protein [Curvivirga aplysinae]|uniref:DUF1192 domain-containing protein n=1 Tax=Curvivirga aplysinae TaxID=2529852 RepID=UPI0012BC1F7B|nr:DUF1192 domain-containing protein [Curvivirga aplysinae]MTI11468.1 DUF1192 domain-containing protein [Curvivirga aplysinae]